MIPLIILTFILYFFFRALYLMLFPKTRIVKVIKDGKEGYVLEALSSFRPFTWTSQWYQWNSGKITPDLDENPCKVMGTPDYYLKISKPRSSDYKRLEVYKEVKREPLESSILELTSKMIDAHNRGDSEEEESTFNEILKLKQHA